MIVYFQEPKGTHTREQFMINLALTTTRLTKKDSLSRFSFGPLPPVEIFFQADRRRARQESTLEGFRRRRRRSPSSEIIQVRCR